jgi:hypothetical protein
MGQNLTFWTFREKPFLHGWTKTAKLATSSEMTIQRNSLRGHDPKQSASPDVSEEQAAFSHLRQFKRTARMRGPLQIQMA